MPEDTLKSHRVGSRKSELALIQTRFVISELEKLCPGHTFDIVEVSTIFLMRILFYHHSDHLHSHRHQNILSWLSSRNFDLRLYHNLQSKQSCTNNCYCLFEMILSMPWVFWPAPWYYSVHASLCSTRWSNQLFLLNFKLVALILAIPRCQRWETTSWTKLFRRSVKNLSSQKSSRWPWRLGRCFFQAHVVIVCLSIFVFVLFFFKELALKPSPAALF